MEYNVPVYKMHMGQSVEGFYILKDAAPKTTAAGKSFLAGAISDITGAVEIKLWDYANQVTPADVGKVVKIRGEVTEFKGALQINIDRIRVAVDTDSYDTASLVPTAPIDVDDTVVKVRRLITSIEDDDFRAVADEMLRRHMDSFVNIPAAKSVHHGFIGGLLMHTSNMMYLADFLSMQYADTINRSLLLTGTLLHDLSKEKEFLFSELGMVTGYSTMGDLIGHLVMGAQETKEVCDKLGVPAEKSMLLQHMILSHHGEPEFGAAVRPMFAEAELLSYIDLIDSRMEIYNEELKNVPEGEFSKRIFALEKKIYNHGLK